MSAVRPEHFYTFVNPNSSDAVVRELASILTEKLLALYRESYRPVQREYSQQEAPQILLEHDPGPDCSLESTICAEQRELSKNPPAQSDHGTLLPGRSSVF